MSGDPLPPGYVRLDPPPPGVHDAVARADVAGALREAVLSAGALYAFAADHPRRVAYRGRRAVYAIPLGTAGVEVVVRHAWRGGLPARLRKDLDLYPPPTRAPGELRTSERLRAAGIRTPAVVAYVVYRAPLGLRRADVATALVPTACDLAAVLTDPAGTEWTRPTAALLAALAGAGVRHPDLNLKNVLLADSADGAAAWVLDVDVCRLPNGSATGRDARAAAAANLARLARSIRKWAAAHPGARAAAALAGLDALSAGAPASHG